MANIQLINKHIADISTDFEKTNTEELSFAVEARFAMQIFANNSFLQDVALKDTDSLKFALRNVSMVGLTLSPVLGLAYLVPRKGKVYLDISYKGMITLLHKVGAVKHIFAELVYEVDFFEYDPTDLGQPIKHKADVFNPQRGKLMGGYAIAVLPNGSIHHTVMPLQEIDSIKARSESVKSGKGSPWDSDATEMMKKTIIRRAFKTIPKTFITPANQDRINAAMELDQQSGEINFDAERQLQKANLDNFLEEIPDAQVVPNEQTTIPL